MKNQTTATTIIVSLVVGLILGYAVWGAKNSSQPPVAMSNGMMMHKMPDGSMMGNGSNGMNMNDMMKGMMAGLEGKTGDAFDKEFLSEMIIHHQGAVEMAKAVLATSKRPELIQLANDIISAQNKEIGMMKEWQKAWFK